MIGAGDETISRPNGFCEFRRILVGFLKSVHEVRPSYRVMLHSNHLLEYVLPFLVDLSWRLGISGSFLHLFLMYVECQWKPRRKAKLS